MLHGRELRAGAERGTKGQEQRHVGYVMDKKRNVFARKVARAREESRDFSVLEDHRPSYVLLPVTLLPPTQRLVCLLSDPRSIGIFFWFPFLFVFAPLND